MQDNKGSDHRIVAAYLKVVRRRKSSSADGTRGGEYERGTPLSLGGLGVSSEKILKFSASICVFNGFYAFGTRFQSRFFAR